MYSYLCVCRYKALKRAASLREQLFKTMRRFDVTLVSTRDQETVLKCIVSGLFTNAAYLHHSGEYRDVLFKKSYFFLYIIRFSFPAGLKCSLIDIIFILKSETIRLGSLSTPMLMVKTHHHAYRTIRGDTPLRLHPGSVLYTERYLSIRPTYLTLYRTLPILFNDLYCTDMKITS